MLEITSLIRRLTSADVHSALELSSLAGWNQTAQDWNSLLKLAPEGCFGIHLEGSLAATTTLLSYGTALAWIGMVLTHPEFRRRGLAKTLLRHVLAVADSRGIATVKLDATEMGEPLYRSLGFVAEQPVERWMSSVSLSGDLSSSRSRDLSHCPELDRSAFGADRQLLLRTLLEYGDCYSAPDAYTLTRQGRNACYVGPCVATDKDSACQVLQLALGNRSTKGWCWDILPANQLAIALAKEFGFQPQRRLLRMFRGEPLRSQEEFIYAIAGFEFG